MTIPTTAINEDSPGGSDNIALGDNRIREFKTQNREILEVDHEYPSTGQSATAGQHKQVTLQEAADIGTGAEGVPILGAQTVSGKAELVFTDEDDNDIQITDNGKIRQQSVDDLPNTTTLKSKDAAGTGTVDLINANASDQAVLPTVTLAEGGVILPEVTLPVTAANQGALYTKNDGTQTELYFGEESAGDEVKITAAGVLANTTELTVGSILDYGTSGTTGTAKTQATLKICYGVMTVAGGGSATVTNLPFTSATSYTVTATFGTSNSPSESLVVVRNSASQITITSTDNLEQAIHWIAIGT